MARNKRKREPVYLSPGQKLLLTAVLLIVLGLCSTMFLDLRALVAGPNVTDDPAAWTDPITAYVMVGEGELTAPFYNEGLAVMSDLGRGTTLLLKSWEPFVTESGEEYYLASAKDQVGYIACSNVTDDQSDLMQETQVYVRATVDLLETADGLTLGPLAQKGTLLRVMGYDYFKDDGTVNMYHVRMGEETGWIQSEYVVLDYGDSMAHWDEEYTYTDHVWRGDSWGGGDAATLDYWPHEKGDFADEGNAMPEDVYALYIPASDLRAEVIPDYLALTEGTAINTFVVTIDDGGVLAFASEVYKEYGLLDSHHVVGSIESCNEAIQMLKDAGFYVVGRISTFSDAVLAQDRPDWAITDLAGQPKQMSSTYWPSAYCRDVWELKVAFAVEAVEAFGLNEIQFDYVRFPDFIQSYEKEGSVDLKNTYNESKAEAIQRFLTYACDILHEHNVYVGADLFGETSNTYVAAYGQYWPAISNVVDVISGMPYPDHFGSYYMNDRLFVPYKNPYRTLYNWAVLVADRQLECATPAVVRTWLQTWDDASYPYDGLAIKREILGLYDASITGGYMLWHGLGSLVVAEDLVGAVEHDYRTLYEEAKAEHQLLSDYMGVPTTDEVAE